MSLYQYISNPMVHMFITSPSSIQSMQIDLYSLLMYSKHVDVPI